MFSLVAGLAVLACAHLADSQLVSPSQLASQNSLTASNTLPFPTAALSSTNDTQSFIVKNWSLSKGRIQNNPEDLTFVDDPFPNSPAPGSQASSGPVLQVTYPKGSYSHGTGGTQLYSLWNTTDGSQWNSMIVSYDVAFDAGFDWVKGGKLPGVRGGPNVDGCSGGDASDGTNCFSSRVMWRKNGAGEVYAYIPYNSDLCKNDNFLCNQDGFGTSIDRGSFTFASGQWNTITMLVRLNDVDKSNGQIALYYNNVKALDQQGIQIRTSNGINIGGFYLSTFFGGDDVSWSTVVNTHTYFRNIQMYASTAASDLSGQPSSAPPLSVSKATSWLLAALSGMGIAVLGGFL